MTRAAAEPIWSPYCGTAPLPAELLSRWNLDPLLLVGLAAVAFALHRAAGDQPRQRLAVAGAGGLALLLFISPFCALTSALFSARVIHHVLLTAAVAPLITFSLPRNRARLPGSLAFWTAVQALVFWAWHAPGLYALALSHDGLYWLMQASLLASAVGFWTAIRRASAPSAVAALLATMVQMGLLGALITFAATPLYAPHFASTLPFGLDALEDQQLAGLIMWAPSAALYLAAALLIAGRLLGAEGRGMAR